MAVFRRLSRHGLWGTAISGAVGLALLLFAGCNRGEDATASQTKSEGVSSSAAKAPATANSAATDAEKGAAAVIAELDGTKAPPKKLVQHIDNVTYWEGSAKPSKSNDDIKPVRLRRRVAEYSDGSSVNDGRYTEWYAPPGHQKMEEGDYVEGVRQGKWTLWHENGKVRRIESFSNGKLDGSWKQYREDGTLESEQSFRNNLRDGKWVAYDSTGKRIDAQFEYKSGVFDGVRTFYYDENDAKNLVEAEQLTKEKAAAMLEKHQKKAELHFKDVQPDGDFTAWWPNGQIQSTRHYKNGQLDGQLIEYKETGEESKRVNYSGGQPILKTTNAAAGSP
jgi:antitoxin component YwqK of YwqJK toxin-antitoxin module